MLNPTLARSGVWGERTLPVGILAKISAFYFEDEQSEAGRRRQRKWVPLK